MKFLSKVTHDNGVSFNLGNGKSLLVRLDELPPGMIHDLAIHGLSQKVGDSAAGFAASQDYSGALESMTQTLTALQQGEWNRRGEGVGKEDIINAVVSITKRPEDEVRSKATAEKLAEWGKNKAVKAYVADAKAKRLLSAVDPEEDLEV